VLELNQDEIANYGHIATISVHDAKQGVSILFYPQSRTVLIKGLTVEELSVHETAQAALDKLTKTNSKASDT
jgi:hypothetical protein